MICFENDGLIEMDFITTFGASQKNSESAIGYFGTGLKYAIAVFLRERQEVTLYRGLDRYEFSTQQKTIRGGAFTIVTMNGEPLGFTTELGKNWEPWMAFRELYANALDEGGSCIRGAAIPRDGVTILAVSGPKAEMLFDDKDSIILPNITPLDISGQVERFSGHSDYIYYRRVRVQRVKQSIYTWSVRTGVQLTEDRCPQYSWKAPDAIARYILSSTDRALIREIITADENTFEADLDYTGCGQKSPSREFLEVAAETSKRGVRIAAKAQQIAEQHCGVMASDVAELTNVEKAKLEKAKKIVRLLGGETDQFPIKVVKSLGPGIYGRARDGTIWLSLFAFEQGTKMVASTLYEEYVHLQFGYEDCSRGMQNFLFERILSLTEEHLLGEPI